MSRSVHPLPISGRTARSFRSLAGIGTVAVLAVVGMTSCSDDTSTASSDIKVTTTAAAASDVTTTTEAGLAADDFVSQANDICTSGNQRLEALFADVPEGQAPTPEQMSSIRDSLLEDVSGQLDAIEALGVPAELTSKVEPFIAAAHTRIEEARTQDVEEFFGSGNPFAEVNALAVTAGLDTCGS